MSISNKPIFVQFSSCQKKLKPPDYSVVLFDDIYFTENTIPDNASESIVTVIDTFSNSYVMIPNWSVKSEP